VTGAAVTGVVIDLFVEFDPGEDGDFGDGDAGVGDAGVGDDGVGDAGVGDAGVGDAGVGDAGVGDDGVGDDGVGAKLTCSNDMGQTPLGSLAPYLQAPVQSRLVGPEHAVHAESQVKHWPTETSKNSVEEHDELGVTAAASTHILPARTLPSKVPPSQIVLLTPLTVNVLYDVLAMQPSHITGSVCCAELPSESVTVNFPL
jgi:hypothetical protein